MAGLLPTDPKDSYKGLLKTTDNANVTSSLKQVTDGDGNNTGLKVSDTKVAANLLRVENALTSTTETTVLVIDGNGDVYEREATNFTFDGFNALIARNSGDTSPLNFYAVDNTNSAASCAFGSGFSIISNNTINVANSGVWIDVVASVYFTPSGGTDDITVSLSIQSTPIRTVREVVTTASGNKEINIHEVWYTNIPDTEIQVEVTKNTGTPTISERSYLEVRKLG